MAQLGLSPVSPLAVVAIAEPDVALTDFGLALLAAILAVALVRGGGGSTVLRRRFVAFFAAVAVASLAGGLDHGFFRQPPGAAHDVLWATALIAIGASALALTGAAAEIGFSGRATRAVSAGTGPIAAACRDMSRLLSGVGRLWTAAVLLVRAPL